VITRTKTKLKGLFVNLTELKLSRQDRFAAADKLVRAARETGKDLVGADLEQYQGHITEIKSIDSLINRCEQVGALAPRVTPNLHVPVNQPGAEVSEERKSFEAFLRRGERIKATTGLNTGVTTEGGFAVQTDLFQQFILKKWQANVVRQLCRQITTAHPTNFAVQNGRATAAWTAEEAAVTASKPTLSQVQVSAYKATSLVLVSEEIMQDDAFDVAGYVVNELGYAFGLLEENAFITGSGTGQPTGLLANATAGITTASPSAILADELISQFHALKPQYRANASWLMHDSTALMIRLLKDGQGRYIWQPGLADDRPDTIVSRPVLVSVAMPAVASTVRSVVFADFSNYLVCDRMPFHIQRLNELYAATGQIGFRGVERVDGKIVNAEGLTALIQHV
jgi:HK97 family phage major capsid protein